MSWTHCAWASKQTAGSPINKLVLMMMADSTSHDNPLLILRIKTLADKCEASESSVKRAIKDLEDSGLLICVERFFENTQQSNAYILVTDEVDPANAATIAKENERSGCFFRVREGGGFRVDPGVGSEGTQGGFSVTPRATPSSSSPSSSQPIYRENSPATKQQPEKATKKAASAQAQAIYDIYPLKVGRGVAIPKIELAIKDCGFDQLLEATKAYAAATRTWTEQDQKFIPHPSTWYHQQRYRDDQREWTRKSVVPVINLQPGARFGSFGHRE